MSGEICHTYPKSGLQNTPFPRLVVDLSEQEQANISGSSGGQTDADNLIEETIPSFIKGWCGTNFKLEIVG